MEDIIAILRALYLFAAMVASVFVARALQRRLEARLPATLPYRWGFYIGTFLSINPVVWVANAIYGSHRWKEFARIPYGSARTESEGYELLRVATKFEIEGRVQVALALYQRIVEQCPDTAAAHDARKSIDSLRARIG